MRHSLYFWIALTLSILGALAFGFGFISNSSGNQRYDYHLLNLLGDYVGGVCGSLWALAGVFLFYDSVSMQRDELKITREEFTHQTYTFGLQRFEHTFFNLLSMLNKQADTMESFDAIKNTLNNNSSPEGVTADKIFEKVLKGNGNYRGLIQYLNSLQVLIHFIEQDSKIRHIEESSSDKSNPGRVYTLNKEKYYEILISNMSWDQKTVIFYVTSILQKSEHSLNTQYLGLLNNLHRFDNRQISEQLKLENIEKIIVD